LGFFSTLKILTAMRLREIQKDLSATINDLIVRGTAIQNTNPQQFRLSNIIKANQAIKMLDSIGLLETEINGLRVSSFFNSPNDEIIVNPQEYNTIIDLVNRIRQASLLFLQALNKSLGSSELIDDKNISVKFEKIGNLNDLESFIGQLIKVIQIPLSEFKEGGEVQIVNFDSGSFWLDIVLPATSCVTLIGSIAWAGAVIYKKWLEAFAFKQYAEGLEIQKEHLETLKKAAKDKIDKDIEAEAKLIQNEYFTPEDYEQLARLKLAIKEYSKLIQKGVQIKPALTAPENVSNLFPTYNPLEILESKIKKIEN
jgi:hypothetical protein